MVVGCFKDCETGGWTRKLVEMYAVLQGNCYVRACEADTEDSRLMLESYSSFLFGVVPDYDFCLRPARVLSTTDKGKVVVIPKHFCYTNAGIQVAGYAELAWFGVENAEACVRAYAEACAIGVEGCGEGDRTLGLIDDRSGVHG